MGDPFFQGMDFDKLMNKELQPPFIPQIDSAIDLSNFDDLITGMEARESVPPEERMKMISLKKDEFAKFGFSIDRDSTRDSF